MENTTPLYDEKKLLHLMAGGSEFAFTQIFDRYRGKIYGVAVKFLKSRVLAEETVQDVFLKVWEKRRELAEVEKLDGYLFMMTRNIIFDRLKKLSVEAAGQKDLFYRIYTTDEIYDRLQDKQYQQILQEAINQLSPQQKQVYMMAKAEGLSHEQIAQQLNISRLTVKKHMQLALQFIRRYLQQHSDAFILLVVFGLAAVEV